MRRARPLLIDMDGGCGMADVGQLPGPIRSDGAVSLAFGFWLRSLDYLNTLYPHNLRL